MWQARVELNGEPAGVFPLREGESVAGRSRQSDIQVNAPDISRAHARIVVAGARVTVENLGKSGSCLDGVALQQVAEWKAGQRLALGTAATLMLEPADGQAAPPPREPSDLTLAETNRETEACPDRTADDAVADRTGAGTDPEADHTGAGDESDRADRTAAMPAETRDGTAFGTRMSMAGGQTDGGRTRAMQTRMVSPEELELLRTVEQARIRKRLVLSIVAAVPALLLLILFRPRPLPPETDIVWPRDEQSRPIQAVEPAPGGGLREGGFDLLVPGAASRRTTPLADGVQVDTVIGRDGDVPFRLVLHEQSDKRYALMGREQLVSEWMEETLRNESGWNFDPPQARLGFYGFEQGIPFTRVPYLRQEGREAWDGMACLFRHGRRRFVLRVETPASERLRTERMLFMRYVKPSVVFERSHWEAEDDTVEKAATEDMLAQIRRDLARVAPLTWARLESRLKAVLIKAVAEDDSAAYREALDMLADLRARQARWFNSQALARDNARAQGDKLQALRIAELAKAVFSNPDDRRYYQVRRWQ